VILRRATAEDTEPIARVEAHCSSTPWSTGAIDGALDQPTATCWVVEDPGVVAFMLGHHTAGVAEIHLIGVHPGHRRRGLATALVERATGDWRARGGVEAFLEVRADNLGALALYRALAWEGVGRRRRYYRDGVDAVVLRKALS